MIHAPTQFWRILADPYHVPLHAQDRLSSTEGCSKACSDSRRTIDLLDRADIKIQKGTWCIKERTEVPASAQAQRVQGVGTEQQQNAGETPSRYVGTGRGTKRQLMGGHAEHKLRTDEALV
eukprot:1160006-Pelagomonas_calceolata.AAC.16